LQHRFTSNHFGAFNKLTTTLAYQKIDEDRIKLKFAGDQTVHNEEDVHVFSLNSDAFKQLNEKNQLQYGLEYTLNKVYSDAYLMEDGIRLNPYVLTRYPDEGSQMTTASLYLRHKIKRNEKLTFSDGLRFSFNHLSARFSNEVDIPAKAFAGSYNALTGAVGLTYRLTKDTRLLANAGTGFRAPNVDDSGKFFDPQDGMVVVPNFNIKPEYVLNADFGIHHKITDVAQIQLDGFYNYLFNAIVRRPATLNGQDSLVYDGLNSKIFSNQNAGKAIVFGFSASVDVQFGKRFSTYFSHNYTKGTDLNENVPLGHIPPQFGEAGLKFKHPKVEASAYIRYNGTKPEELYSPFGEDKESEALNKKYTPGWNTVNLKFNSPISKHIQISGGVENIFDRHYKPFSSGISGPGRNFILALRSIF